MKGEDIERMLICVDVLKGLISKISESTEVTSSWSPLVKGRIELPWSSKAYIIYFLLHPSLGNSDAALTSRLFNINPITLIGWLRKPALRGKWYNLVKQLKLEQRQNLDQSNYHLSNNILSYKPKQISIATFYQDPFHLQ